MKALVATVAALPLFLHGEVKLEGLKAEDFREREKTQQALFEKAERGLAGEDIDDFVESYFQFAETDPEARLRMWQLLYELKKDSIPRTGNGAIGISMPEEDDDFDENGLLIPKRGVLVGDAIENMPAKEAGVKPGDIITAIDGASLAGPAPQDALMDIIFETLPGANVKLSIIRGEQPIEIEVQVVNKEVLPLRTRGWGAPLPGNAELEEKARLLDFQRWLESKRPKATKNDVETKP